jgi:hypothetical protein
MDLEELLVERWKYSLRSLETDPTEQVVMHSAFTPFRADNQEDIPKKIRWKEEGF